MRTLICLNIFLEKLTMLESETAKMFLSNKKEFKFFTY